MVCCMSVCFQQPFYVPIVILFDHNTLYLIRINLSVHGVDCLTRLADHCSLITVYCQSNGIAIYENYGGTVIGL